MFHRMEAGSLGNIGTALWGWNCFMSLPSCMLASDQAGILVGMDALEEGVGGVVFRFSLEFWNGVG